MTEPSGAVVVVDAQSAPHPPPPVLRRIPWPQLSPVDLLAQCPWLVLQQNPLDEWVNRESPQQDSDELDPEQEEVDEGRYDDTHVESRKSPQRPSPLKQRLRARRDPPASLSPAQRAAKTILKLQEEMEKQEVKNSRLEASQEGKQLTKAPVDPSAPVKTATSPSKSTLQNLRKPVKAKTTKVTVDESPERRLQQWLAKQRLPSNDSVAASAYSMEMETRIHNKMHDTLGEGLWKDEIASQIAAELSSESVFGGFVPTRRLAFDLQGATTATSPAKARLERAEPPANVHPVKMNSRDASPIVVGTDAHDSDMSAQASKASAVTPVRETTREPLEALLRVSAVELFADEVRDNARELVAEGHVHNALLSLQAGIDRVLHDFQSNQDELVAHGFDYSALAHRKAIRLQLTYKARHRRRLASLVVLQRVWRRFRARNKFLKDRQYQATNAKAIQLYYKKRFYHRKRERSATRIQRCFRVFQQQKTLIRLHQACRMLNMHERRKRERMQARKALRRRLWSKMKIMLRLIRLFKVRRFSICWLQSHWRGWKARQSYSTVLSIATKAEAARRMDEDAFVEPRLARVMEFLSGFYRETVPGRAQVQWTVRQPWLHWRRLRSEWKQVMTSDRVAALCGIYGHEAVVRGLELSAIGALLVGTVKSTPNQQVITMNNDSLLKWLDSASQEATPAAEDPQEPHTPSHFKDKVRTIFSSMQTKWRTRVQTIERRVVTARDQVLWRLVFYPRLVLRDSQQRRQRQEDAAQELLADQRRVWRGLLRHVFRVAENARPKFVCTWCGEGHATAKAHYSHCNASEGCVEQQRRAAVKKREMQADVHFHTNRFKITGKWWRHETKSIATIEPSLPALKEFDSARGSRLAKKRGNKNALHRLVDSALCCGPPGTTGLLPQELLALLLWSLDEEEGHSLDRMRAFAMKDAVWDATGVPPAGWLTTEEVDRALFGASTATSLKARLLRLEEAMKGRWSAWRDRAHRYRSSGRGPPRVLAES